jgi:hypothetical protein
VHADPPEPSDYESVIVAVDPPNEAIRPRLIGDGAVFELAVAAGTEVVVLGYQEEPYVRFRPDGTVEENELAPTTYLNRSVRGDPIPPDADPSHPPRWVEVAADGHYAWHDHRTHWMGREPPPAAIRGEEVQHGVVELLVDGSPVDVSVTTRWVAAPSPVPLLGGVVLGAALLVVTALLRRPLRWTLLVASAAALLVGWWQYRSVPSEIGPPVVWWLLPAIAVVSSVLALVVPQRTASAALSTLAALELIMWTYLRRDVAFRATIPTDAPFWFDRGVMAFTAAVAVVVAVTEVAALLRPPVSVPPPALRGVGG